MESKIRKEIIDAVSYIQMSPYREEVLKALETGFKIPSKISKSTGIRTSHVSRALKGLKEKGLVICLNEEASQGRLYMLTDLGKEVLELIKT